MSPSTLPDDYPRVLALIKEQVRGARLRAHVVANTELVRLYWTIGNTILQRQAASGWGSKIIEQLAADLRVSFPKMTGLSRSNLHYMRAFAGAWPDEVVPQPVGQLPWSHIRVLLDKLDDRTSRDWYAAAAVENGWSRAVLLNQIRNQTRRRVGAAPSNFSAVLPTEDSELAQQIARDPYVFDFLDLTGRVAEAELEDALADRIQRTLSAFGQGFSFVGRQYRFDVDGKLFKIDLLLFNIEQVRYVVVELKIDEFDPSYLGQLGMYVAWVDDNLRRSSIHAATVGILLCAGRNERVVQYALAGSRRAVAVADYTYEALPDDVREVIPSPEIVVAAVESPVVRRGCQLTIDEYLSELDQDEDGDSTDI